jgi:replicative superfamily II helicase
MTIYREVRSNLKSEIDRYRNRLVDLNTLKSAMWRAAMLIVSIEEIELRLFLQRAESELDMIQHTVEDSEQFAKALEVLEKVVDKIDRES